MKIEEIEGAEKLATKLDLRELREELVHRMNGLELSVRESRVDVREQFAKIKVLLWLPVIAVIVQTIAGIVLRALHLI